MQYSYRYDAMGNPTERTEDAGTAAYTYNELNQLVTGDWSGTLSAFGSVETGTLDTLTVQDGQQTVTADVFQNEFWTAKGLNPAAGLTTPITVTRTDIDQTTQVATGSVNRPVALPIRS